MLAEEGVKLTDLKIKGIRSMFFSKGERAAVCRLIDLHYEIAPGERHPERQKLVLAFQLPRGCYGTVIVKRVTAAS